MSKGTKNDSKKARLDLLPLEGLEAAANAMAYGADKYGKLNYQGGIEHSRLIAAALRHINQYNSCEDIDEESGNSHVDHAIASLMMLAWMVKNKPELDDRKDSDNKEHPKRNTFFIPHGVEVFNMNPMHSIVLEDKSILEEYGFDYDSMGKKR